VRYLLDSNTFIEAKNRYYTFDICPGFWEWLVNFGQGQSVLSLVHVKKEMQHGKDELADWITDLPNSYFIEAEMPIQHKFKRIVNFVLQHNRFSLSEKSKFLDKADPWLIAAAMSEHVTVITQEKEVGNNSTKIKIPNICNHFEVPYLNIFELLHQENVKFVLG